MGVARAGAGEYEDRRDDRNRAEFGDDAEREHAADGFAATNGCTGTVASGAAIDTSAGAHSFSVTARDVAGNQATTIVTYNVGYRVCLLYDPTKPQPMTGTVPVKLQCDAAGR